MNIVSFYFETNKHGKFDLDLLKKVKFHEK